MSDEPGYVCYNNLDDTQCVPCLNTGGNFVSLMNYTRCCTSDINLINGDVIGVVRNASLCPFVPPPAEPELSFGFASIIPGIAGAVFATSLFFVGRFILRAIRNRFGSHGSSTRAHVDQIELLALNNSLPANNEDLATQAAQALNAGYNDEPLMGVDDPPNYGSIRALDAPAVLTISNPVYDSLHGTVDLYGVPPYRPISGGATRVTSVASSTAGSSRSQRRLATLPEEPQDQLLPFADFDPDWMDNDEEEQDTRAFRQLRRWGKGRCRVQKTKTEWEATTEF